MGSSTPQDTARIALARAALLPSGMADTVGFLIGLFRSSQFRDTQPAYAPVQRFACDVAAAFAWLGVRMVATPFLYDSFIHYFPPVYPDASSQDWLPHKTSQPPFLGLLITAL